MLKKSFLLCLFILLLLPRVCKADEGLWLLSLIDRLNYIDMKNMGLHLSPEEIYSVNKSCLKDAIVSINDGSCAGTIISEEGLFITNHHCAFNYIQAQSSVEKDYLKNGFWAISRYEELKNDKLTASFLVSMEDITQKVLSELNSSMTDDQREAKIREISAKIEHDAVAGTKHNASVSNYFEGNEFYLFIYDTFRDVRFVGAPPSALSTFGNITDNWQWPRHVADFSLFRIYTSPQGEPADYNKKNIPYKPKYVMPISLKGYEKGDFSMIIGFPQTTDRFLSSYGLALELEQKAKTVIKLRLVKLNIMKEYMDSGDEAYIKYAVKFFNSDNYYKYFKGQLENCERLNVLEKKKEFEAAFTSWVHENSTRTAKYGNVLDEIAKAYDEIQKYNIPRYYFREGIERGAEIISLSKQFENLYSELSTAAPNQKSIDSLSTALKYVCGKHFRDYDKATDKKLFIALMNIYYLNVPKDFHPEVLQLVQKKYKGSMNSFADDVYDKTIFASKDKIMDFLAAPNKKALDIDPAYKLMTAFYEKYKQILNFQKAPNMALRHANRTFLEGIIEMQNSKHFYPNGNYSMRLSYGKVNDYTSATGNKMPYSTTFSEMIKKENPEIPEFKLNDKVKDLYFKRDFGKYASNGALNTCFITDIDQTGGSSGGPVINADGQLIGITFDINNEATSAALAFDGNYLRSINVDIRFVLWTIDKYAGATNLIKEMKIAQ